jgi:hypothetical protein
VYTIRLAATLVLYFYGTWQCHCFPLTIFQFIFRESYSTFTDKVERSCHFPAAAGAAIKKEVDFIAFVDRYLSRIGGNPVALGGESCSFIRELGSDSCV